ncbi:hypothetical protein CPB86DRAFT_818517 [Serendipita vermifera]|nr:hypothetical protein CPB86DRAFT_818517 [Serendipita vermifera]
MTTFKASERYKGQENLVIALDIGTTHTSVSYSYLYPGDFPEVRSVLRWPGQPESASDSRIPTIAGYQSGRLVAVGAEARAFSDDDSIEMAIWFKLHLHPKSMRISDLPPKYNAEPGSETEIEIPPLPNGVSLSRVYADLISYVYDYTRVFFISTTPNGANIWQRLARKMIFVFCTPNGWDAIQQGFLRSAAVQAALVMEQDADGRIDFITEGEASVHYALQHSKSNQWLRPGFIFAVTDAGGSTVDSTLYECKSAEPLRLEEVCASECVQAGGVFVDRAMWQLLEGKLQGSHFGDQEIVVLMGQRFEEKTKRQFDGGLESYSLQFGTSRDNDRQYGILKGRLMLSKDEIASVFANVIDRIVESCLKLLRGRKISYLLLVGGFGESPYLRKILKDRFGSHGTEVVTVDEPTKKASAEGAAIWYIEQLVKARAVRFTIGTDLAILYDPRLPAHKEREASCIDAPGGNKYILTFEPWLQKDTVIDEAWELVKVYYDRWDDLPEDLGDYKVDVYAWEGQGETTWLKDDRGNLLSQMRLLCTIQADLNPLRPHLQTTRGPNGKTFWYTKFEVAVKFGGTRLQARLRWMEGTTQREGPVNVLPHTIF